MTTHPCTVSTAFGALPVQRAPREELAASRLRYYPWRTTYAVNGGGITGYMSIDPHFADTPGKPSLFLPAETVRELVPTLFSVRFGNHGHGFGSDGSPVQTDGILLVDQVEVLSAGLTLGRGGDMQDFPVSRRIGAYASTQAQTLTAAKTHQVVRSVLALHETDHDLVSRMDHAYAQHMAKGRRKAALEDLREAEELSAMLQGRAQRLRSYITQLDSTSTEPAE